MGIRRLAGLAVRQGVTQMTTERTRWMVDMVAVQDRDLMLQAWNETMAFDSRRRLGEIGCPTLIVAGSKDVAVPIQHAKMLHEGIRRARLDVIEGAGHALLWTHTGEFLRAADAFLST